MIDAISIDSKEKINYYKLYNITLNFFLIEIAIVSTYPYAKEANDKINQLKVGVNYLQFLSD